MKACKGPLFHSHVLNQRPVLFSSPNKHTHPHSHRGYPEWGKHTLRSMWGLPPPSGETHLVSKLCVLCRGATQMAPQPICLKLLILPGRVCAEDKGRTRWFGSLRWSAGSILATTSVTACVLCWPLNVVAFSQALRAARIFNQISYFFPKFPLDWFTHLLLILRGGVNPSLQSAIPTSTDWCYLHAVVPTASPESHEWEPK